jgi:hypothetical protein
MKTAAKLLCLALFATMMTWSFCFADDDDDNAPPLPKMYNLGEEAPKPKPKPKVIIKERVVVQCPPGSTWNANIKRCQNDAGEDISPPPAPPQAAKPAPPPYTPPPVQAEQSPPTYAPSGDDGHYIQGDDAFIADHGLGNSAWMYVTLAKVVNPPTAATKGEGEFMQVRDGRNKWTKYHWRTRIADRSELHLGMHLIAFNDHNRDGVYMAPEKKDRARGGSWFYAKITDMSDMHKGYVTVSGNYKVNLRNIRIILR